MSLRTRILETLQPQPQPQQPPAGDAAPVPHAGAPANAPAADVPDAASPAPSFLDQVNLVHTALFGWPCDHLTPLDDYLACGDIHQVALKMLDSSRFRWDIREKVGLWPQDKWVMADFRGLQIWVNLFDGFVSFGVLHGRWENAEVDFMLSCLRPGDGMIDAGANIGVFTLQAARAVGETGRVYAFEPMRTTFGMLERSVWANGFQDRCRLYNAGLGAGHSSGSFHLSSYNHNPGSSHISTDASGGEIIRIRPIDDIEYERPVRFIKMDVEGFEPHIIRGAVNTLRRHAPVILTEFFPGCLRKVGGCSGAGYIAMLEELGYTMSIFSESGEGEPLTSADAHRYDDIVEPLNVVCRPGRK
jgi:FkbM family methyltransferase